MAQTGLIERAVNLITTKEVKPDDTITIQQGKSVIFGADPKASPDFTPDSQAVKLTTGVEPNQLSRAAVEVSITREGRLVIKNLTGNNQVDLQYMANDTNSGNWTNYQIAPNSAVPEAIIKEARGGWAIDILTENDTLIRLYGVGYGGNISRPEHVYFTVQVNPVRDLNARRSRGVRQLAN